MRSGYAISRVIWLFIMLPVLTSCSTTTDGSGNPIDSPESSAELPPAALVSTESSGDNQQSEEESESADFEAPSLENVSFQSDAPFDGKAVSMPEHEVHALSSAEVEALNSADDSTWVATWYEEFAEVDMRTRTGVMIDPESFKTLPMIVHEESSGGEESVGADDIPATFDARVKWPSCRATIGRIRDQGQCGSCWAASSAGAMSDRLCIHKKKTGVHVAASDLINCCGERCGSPDGNGCQGGWMDKAFNYWKSDGLPSEKCEKYVAKFTSCTRNCDSSSPTWAKDKSFGATSYRVRDNDAKAMQRDIMKYGSLVIDFDFYPDFPTYKSGIYQHQGGGVADGGHAMRIIGWGEEKGIPYWTVANSWGTWWGENGYVRFLRGSNHCGIETYVIGGLPK